MKYHWPVMSRATGVWRTLCGLSSPGMFIGWSAAKVTCKNCLRKCKGSERKP